MHKSPQREKGEDAEHQADSKGRMVLRFIGDIVSLML
jgi:hypothetical protein